ncbi:N-acetylmuramoyl-L-alanine amidase [Pedobacter sp. P351]|uniref:N-acetylmuramoyl-L-alanine amidase family protein n=1 Tax=Pedobacter superstes TaxID=3133441 RepID=UPI0030B34C50
MLNFRKLLITLFAVLTGIFICGSGQKVFSQSLRNESSLINTPFRIVLDPGHGGRDSVTRSGGVYEKNIVLTIAKEIRSHLEKSGFEVVMTRNTDEFVPLGERAMIKGDVFISLHANSVADTIGPSVRSMIKGMEIYTGKSTDGDTVLMNKNQLLAGKFKEQLTGLRGINCRFVKQKSLAVLNQNRTAAILIELGFLTNQEDLAFLTDRNNYQQIADAFINAIKAYQLALK